MKNPTLPEWVLLLLAFATPIAGAIALTSLTSHMPWIVLAVAGIAQLTTASISLVTRVLFRQPCSRARAVQLSAVFTMLQLAIVVTSSMAYPIPIPIGLGILLLCATAIVWIVVGLLPFTKSERQQRLDQTKADDSPYWGIPEAKELAIIAGTTLALLTLLFAVPLAYVRIPWPLFAPFGGITAVSAALILITEIWFGVRRSAMRTGLLVGIVTLLAMGFQLASLIMLTEFSAAGFVITGMIGVVSGLVAMVCTLAACVRPNFLAASLVPVDVADGGSIAAAR